MRTKDFCLLEKEKNHKRGKWDGKKPTLYYYLSILFPFHSTLLDRNSQTTHKRTPPNVKAFSFSNWCDSWKWHYVSITWFLASYRPFLSMPATMIHWYFINYCNSQPTWVLSNDQILWIFVNFLIMYKILHK